MANIPGVRFDVTGASGSQGLLGPKDSWRCYVLPRGGHAAQDSSGSLITFDSSDIASRFSVNDWIQAGTSVANIRKVSAVGGNSISFGGAVMTVTENQRIFRIGTTQPSTVGNSATYIPATTIRQRGDDSADTYTNSMVTTNNDGLVQFYAGPQMYDLLIQDGNQTNQGYIADLEVGTVEGVSMIDAAYFGATVTITGNEIVSGTGVIPRLGPVSGVSLGPAFRIVDGRQFTTIQAAINDLPSWGGTIWVGQSFTITSGVVVGQDVTVEMSPAAIITKGFSGTMFTLSGARARVVNLNLDGAKASFGGRGIYVSAADCVVDSCRITNNGSYGIITEGNRTSIRHNRVTGNDDIAIFAQNGATDCRINDNDADSTSAAVAGAHAIASHSSGGDISGTIISNNRCTAGGSAAFCIEVGKFLGGTTPSNCVVTGNVCTSASSGAGGISLATCNDSVVSANSYNAGSTTPTIAGIEITVCDSVSVTGNHVIGSSTTPAAITLSTGSKRCACNGNTIDGFGTTAATNVGIWINSSTAGVNTDRNVVANNTIIFPANGAGTGIRVQANSIGGTCDGNVVSGNVIIGTGAASSIGIVVNGTNGTLSDCMVQGNLIHNVSTGISTNAATTITQKTRFHNNYMSPSVTTHWSADSIQNITGATTTLWAGTNYLRLTANGSTYTISNAPTLADSFDGDRVIIMNVDTADGVVLQDQGTLASSNLRLSGTSVSLGPRDSIELVYNSTVGDWVQVNRSDVI